MKKQLLLLAFGLLLAPTFAQKQSNKKLSTEIDKIMVEQFKEDGPGATILVSKNNEVIFKKAYGLANLEYNVPMQIDNVFRIGSITKQFTAVSILKLMEQGKLKLDDEITKFIPDYPTQGHKITVEHLLTHTSGIPSFTSMTDYMERMSLDFEPIEIIDHFKNEQFEFAPGTNWNYSNSGYFLLGYIIEKVSEQTYPQYIEENLFKPLGMSNSLYASNSKIIKNRAGMYALDENELLVNALPISMTQPYSAGSIQSTVEDLYKWHQALNSYKVVKKETLEKAFTKYKLVDGKETAYGYGWFLRSLFDSPTIEHGGGINGALTASIYLPKEDVFVTIFSNCECNHPEDPAIKIAALAIGKTLEFKEIKLESSVLESYTGVFKNDKGEQRNISISEGKLYSQRSRGLKYEIKAFDKDKFFFDDAVLTVTFFRNEGGEIEKLIVSGRQGDEEWIKTDETFETAKELKVDQQILTAYVGEYEIMPEFTFVISLIEGRTYLQATGQEQVEIFAETETKFFLKVNDARLEFVRDDSGAVVKAILEQGGRRTDAKKIK